MNRDARCRYAIAAIERRYAGCIAAECAGNASQPCVGGVDGDGVGIAIDRSHRKRVHKKPVWNRRRDDAGIGVEVECDAIDGGDTGPIVKRTVFCSVTDTAVECLAEFL